MTLSTAAIQRADQPRKKVDGSEPNVAKVIDSFIKHIDGLRISFPLTFAILQISADKAAHHRNEFLAKHYPKETKSGQSFQIQYEHFFQYDLLNREAEAAAQALLVVPRTLLVALVSQFDAFIGDLLRALFYLRPELLNMSERALTFAELVEIGSIEQAREHIIEKEVETVLRKSHADQFTWLEEKFGLPLRKNLPAWHPFIELTERRNLFVHANGVVSNQYVKVCKQHDVDLAVGTRAGTQLNVDEEYFVLAYKVVYELGVKLAHVLWRQQHPQDLEAADTSMIGITFRLLQQEKFSLATDLLHFATSVLKKHASEQSRRRLVVNLAQAYKWTGKRDEARAIMSAEDWSATGLDFQLVKAVLEDDFRQASDVMLQIGSDGLIKKNDYSDWPIFREFRRSDEFLATFKEIFGDDFQQFIVEDRNVTITLTEATPVKGKVEWPQADATDGPSA